MTEQTVARNLTAGMRSVAAGAQDPAAAVELYLEKELQGFPPEDRLRHLETVAAELAVASAPLPDPGTNPAAVREMVSHFLGNGSQTADLSPGELATRFGASLDTLFDTLNEIVATINITLLGQAPELETIRKVIGSGLHGETPSCSIKEYLDKIRKAFLVSHESFQDAAGAVLAEILSGLDPESQPQTKMSALMFGPLRKAELFDQLTEKHQRCKRWLESGEYRERFLREFEKQCQRRFNGAAR